MQSIKTFLNVEMTEEYFGPLWPYVKDDDITDIEFNGQDLWITSVTNERERVEGAEISKSFVDRFSQHISNLVSKPLNKGNPVLEAENPTMRISIIHESVAITGRSICIRKTLPWVRIKAKTAVESGYASEEILSFLCNCIKAHMSIVICGEPGAGKTECAKFFSRYIPDNERVITIEDNLEWHYREIHPKADAVEIKVSDEFPYITAIKACLRQDPKWMMISEIRGEEAKDYVTGISTGVNGITTLHTDDARKVPERIVNMVSDRTGADRMETDIYTFLDIAVLLTRRMDKKGKIRRTIDQIVAFSYEHGEMICKVLYNEGKRTEESLPAETIIKFKRENIENPFVCEQMAKEIRE